MNKRRKGARPFGRLRKDVHYRAVEAKMSSNPGKERHHDI